MLRKVFSIISGDVRRTLTEALSLEIPSKKLQELLRANKDFRLLPREVANDIGIEESQLMERVSKSLRLTYLARVPSIDLRSLSAVVSLSRLRTLGATLVGGKDQVLGIVCIDPGRCLDLSRELGVNSFYISSWSKIAHALQESEDLLSRAPDISLVEASSSKDKALKALRYLVFEAREHRSKEILVYLDESGPRYEFKSGSRTAKGTFNGSLLTSLRGILDSDAWSNLREFPFNQTSVVRVGSADCIRLKLSDSPSASIEDLECTKEEPKGKLESEGESVLLVEDDPVFAEVLIRYLKRESYSVEYFKDAESALNHICTSNRPPNLIVSDLYLPRMSGRDLVATLRKRTDTRGVPFIVLTSDSSVESELATLSSGADILLPKSKDPRILCAHIRRILDRSSFVLKEVA